MPGTRHTPAGRLWLALGAAVLVPALVGMPAGAAPTVPERRRPAAAGPDGPPDASVQAVPAADVRAAVGHLRRAQGRQPGRARSGAEPRGARPRHGRHPGRRGPGQARSCGVGAHREARVVGRRHRGRRLRRGDLGPGAGQGEVRVEPLDDPRAGSRSTDPIPARRRRGAPGRGTRPADDRGRDQGAGPHRHPVGAPAEGNRAHARERPERGVRPARQPRLRPGRRRASRPS